MFQVFQARCPVSDRERDWIEESLRWFRAEFGDTALHGDVLTPSPEFFPAAQGDVDAYVRALLGRVCVRMAVDIDRVRLQYESDAGGELLRDVPHIAGSGKTAAGHYQRQGDSMLLSITNPAAHSPVELAAIIAHELGHERLLGENRIDENRADGEPLTDLATVFFGMGIFTANAAFEFRGSVNQGWASRRLGYMTEQMYGYALACYARMRGETAMPAWSKHLDTNPRVYMRKGLKYLGKRKGREETHDYRGGEMGGRAASRRIATSASTEDDHPGTEEIS